MQQFEFEKPREFGDIISDTFQYLRINFKPLGKALLFFAVPLYIIQALLMKDVSQEMLTDILNNPENIDSLNAIFNWKYFSGIFLSVIASAVLAAVTYKHLRLSAAGLSTEPEAIKTGLTNLVSAYIALYLIMGTVLFFSSIFFLIPGIFIGIRWALAPAALILEDNSSITSAMKRSWHLVRGSWWQTLGLIVVTYIIITFSTYIVVIPATLLTLFASTAGDSGVLAGAVSIIYSLSAAFASLLQVIMYIALALHFYNLRERKEGGGLSSKIEQLYNQ